MLDASKALIGLGIVDFNELLDRDISPLVLIMLTYMYMNQTL